MNQLEVEIKFRVHDPSAFAAQLQSQGLTMKTARTFERNALYDTPKRDLLNSGRLLRLRQYGARWVMTFKAKPDTDDPVAPHKSRIEIETEVEDGDSTALIFERLGYRQSFVYEKWRTEWEDSEGHVTLDETPIGLYAELEGSPAWIDAMAAKLGITRSEYITLSYGRLFDLWRKEHHSPAQNLTFAEVETAESTG